MTTSLHADLLAVAESLQAANIVQVPGGSIEQVRDYVDRSNAFVGRESVSLAEEQWMAIETPHGLVPIKLYWPDSADDAPLLFYCHGGGFRQGSVEGWDAPMRQLVRASGCAVLSIDYALAPEHKFPMAYNQVLGVIQAVSAAGRVGGHAVSRFAAGGDSAGANLILGAAIALRDGGYDLLAHLMLLYGVYSKDVARPSWEALGGYGLSAEAMRGVWNDYLSQDEDDWRIQPLHADMSGLPPMRLTIGDLDPLIDENRVLYNKVSAAEGAVTLTIMPSVNHGVVRFNIVAPVVAAMIEDEAAALFAAFA